MANANTPRGLIPYKYVSGAPYNGAANIYYVATGAGNIFVGDPLIPTGTSDANGVPGITLATAGATNYLIGSMVSIVAGGAPLPTIPVLQSSPVYHPASTGQYILVADDPNLIFQVQEDSAGAVMSVDSSSANVDLASGSGSTVTGYSGWQLDSSTPVGTGATLQMRVIRPDPAVGNEPGSAYTKWLCKINLHSLTNTTGI